MSCFPSILPRTHSLLFILSVGFFLRAEGEVVEVGGAAEGESDLPNAAVWVGTAAQACI